MMKTIAKHYEPQALQAEADIGEERRVRRSQLKEQ